LIGYDPHGGAKVAELTALRLGLDDAGFRHSLNINKNTKKLGIFIFGSTP